MTELAPEGLRARNAFLGAVLDGLPHAIVITDVEGRIEATAGATERLTGRAEAAVIGHPLSTVLRLNPVAEALRDPAGGELVGDDGAKTPVSLVTSPVLLECGSPGTMYVATDVGDRRRAEVDLRHAQQLESIGQLAAGVAHEINTPVQFVSDSVDFLAEAMTDLLELVERYSEARIAMADDPTFAALAASLADQEIAADLEFVVEEAPRSLERTKEGLRRVADIVRAMKQFSHPGGPALEAIDLNEVIETTLTVARNEYKYVADVETRLGVIPLVVCDRGDVSQVVLNLLVNAVHAIEDASAGERGRIVVETSPADDGVVIRITDTGGGVPDDVRERIFDPFFTTKEPGRGTGQGLALAHSIVVDRHRGRIDLQVDPGVGSTFSIWVPLEHRV